MENKATTRLFGMLGFAMRAGKIIIGTEPVCASLPKKGAARPRVVFVARSASDGTKKKIFSKCEYYGVTAKELDVDGEVIGQRLGKLYAPAVIAVIDDRFAEEMLLAAEAMAQHNDV